MRWLFFRIAFIDFDTTEAAQKAMQKMNRKSLEGRQIIIEFAETRDGGKPVHSMFFSWCKYFSSFFLFCCMTNSFPYCKLAKGSVSQCCFNKQFRNLLFHISDLYTLPYQICTVFDSVLKYVYCDTYSYIAAG